MTAMAGAAVLLLAALLIGRATAADVEARLDRDSVPAGEGANLTLRISGGRAGRPEIPEVANLIVQPNGQSQQMQIINGTTTVSVIYQYAVGSHTPGDYQIPAINVTVDGQKLVTQPLKLKVLAAGAGQPPAGVPPNAGGPQPVGDGEGDAGGKRFGFLTISPVAKDRKYVYVGEIAPVCIQAWIPADARAQLRSGIQPEGKAFTLHHVSERPQQTYQIKDGKRYLVVTWFGGISATKAGNYPASLSVDATVAVRDTSTPKPRRRMGGPFNDPFFDSFFDDMSVPMIQKNVTLKSDDQEIEVRPLPTAARPNGFTGAVGDFTIDAWEMPAAWQTGEPQQIDARLSGSGNFALMNTPDLTPADAWKVYPSKGEFTAGDNASFSGSKRFQFSAMPRKGGAQDVALTFSFFNPNAGAYETITSPVKKIHVTGPDIADDKPAALPPATEPAKKMEDGKLVAQHQTMSPQTSLVPLVSRPAFIPLLAAGGALCLLGLVLARVRVRLRDPQRSARVACDRATRLALLAANRCAATSDVAGFFAAARLAIQQQLGALWNQPAQAITLAEILTRIPDDSPVARFFREADRQAYSHPNTGNIPPQWRTLLANALACLTNIAR
ncbi:MAG: BatD family protein [Verrucomicrobia bacterium]|nr:BatD family protein [Verrucomicrobiota bacterium]